MVILVVFFDGAGRFDRLSDRGKGLRPVGELVEPLERPLRQAQRPRERPPSGW